MIGDFALLDADGDVLAYERRHGAERLIVALNLARRLHHLQLPDWATMPSPSCPLSPSLASIEDGMLLLQSDEGVILLAD